MNSSPNINRRWTSSHQGVSSFEQYRPGPEGIALAPAAEFELQLAYVWLAHKAPGSSCSSSSIVVTTRVAPASWVIGVCLAR